MDTKDVKSLHELIADTESWSVVDVKFDELVQIDAGDVLSCFSKLTEPDLIFNIFDLVKNEKPQVWDRFLNTFDLSWFYIYCCNVSAH